jgi:CubicO group peptidase (beta-lactamase class C family)
MLKVKFLRNIILLCLLLNLISCSTPTSDENALPRSAPEARGISSASIRAFLDAAEESGLEFHSIMILRHGHVVAEGWWHPFAPELKHTLYSLSKSFTSTAIGMLVADGKISVEDNVLSFFPEYHPAEASENLAKMQVKHLLTMTTGHEKETIDALLASDGNWPKAFLAQEVTYEPGTRFLYNTGATYMLSAILQKVTGQTLFDFLSERLFQSLGIEGADWEADPQGIHTGGYGLRVKTEDIAKFGQFYLQKGKWNSKQLLPESWVEEATRKQTDSQEGDNDWSQGYGYQFWRCKPEPGFYRGDGAFGQYCIVIPQKDAVIAITAESPDMQASMNLVWEHILPAFEDQPLEADPESQQQLAQALNDLAIEPPKISPRSPIERHVSGKEFKLDPNEWAAQSVTFTLTGDSCIFTIRDSVGNEVIKSEMNQWTTGNNARMTPGSLFSVAGRTAVPTKIASSATWQSINTLILTWRYIENIHTDRLTCVFEENKVTITFLNSVADMRNEPDARKPLVGRL